MAEPMTSEDIASWVSIRDCDHDEVRRMIDQCIARAVAAEREACATRIEVAADAWMKDMPDAARRLMNLATQIRQG